MQLGTRGSAGRMGGNMRERLSQARHEAVGYDFNQAISMTDIAEWSASWRPHRVSLGMVPAPEHTRGGTIRTRPASWSGDDPCLSTAATRSSRRRPTAPRDWRPRHRLTGRMRRLRRRWASSTVRADGRRLDADVGEGPAIFDALNTRESRLRHSGGVGAGHYDQDGANGHITAHERLRRGTSC